MHQELDPICVAVSFAWLMLLCICGRCQCREAIALVIGNVVQDRPKLPNPRTTPRTCRRRSASVLTSSLDTSTNESRCSLRFALESRTADVLIVLVPCHALPFAVSLSRPIDASPSDERISDAWRGISDSRRAATSKNFENPRARRLSRQSVCGGSQALRSGEAERLMLQASRQEMESPDGTRYPMPLNRDERRRRVRA